MKTTLTRCLLFISLLVLSANAFGFDQVILKSGAVIKGEIIDEDEEEFSEFVSIKLPSGTTKRYPQSQIASVERDASSPRDSRHESNSDFYLGGQIGMELSLDTTITANPSSIFVWGLRAGWNATQVGNFAKLALGASFTHSEKTLLTTTTSSNSLLAQLLFREVAHSGFYFGPEFGINVMTGTSTVLASTTFMATPFMFGFVGGYDYYVNPDFSLGPDIRYESVGVQNYTMSGAAYTSNPSYNQMQFLFTATFHL